MLMCEKLEIIEQQKQEMENKRTIELNKRLDEIRGLDDTVNADNSFTDSGRRLIMLSAYFMQWSLIAVASKNYEPMVWMMKTFPRLSGTLNDLQNEGLFNMFEEAGK